MDTFTIIGWIVTIIISFVGSGLISKIIAKSQQVKDVTVQLKELFEYLPIALSDNVLTAQEVENIYKEAKDVYEALGALVSASRKITEKKFGAIGKIGDKNIL